MSTMLIGWGDREGHFWGEERRGGRGENNSSEIKLVEHHAAGSFTDLALRRPTRPTALLVQGSVVCRPMIVSFQTGNSFLLGFFIILPIAHLGSGVKQAHHEGQGPLLGILRIYFSIQVLEYYCGPVGGLPQYSQGFGQHKWRRIFFKPHPRMTSAALPGQRSLVHGAKTRQCHACKMAPQEPGHGPRRNSFRAGSKLRSCEGESKKRWFKRCVA